MKGDEKLSPDTVISSCTKLLDELRKKQQNGTLSNDLATPAGIAGAFAGVYFRRSQAYHAKYHKGNIYELNDLNKGIELAQSFKVLDVVKDYRGVRGCVLVDMAQQLDLALSDIATAIEGRDATTDSNSKIYVTSMLECRGSAYLQKGLAARAAQDFSASLKLQPDNQEALNLLGIARRQLANQPSTKTHSAGAEEGLAAQLPVLQGRGHTFVCRISGSVEPWVVTADLVHRSLRIEYRTENTKLLCEILFVDGGVAPGFRGKTGDICAYLVGNPNVRQSVTIIGSSISASGGNLHATLDMSNAILRTASGVDVCRRQ
jgi:hypothetical protein